MVFFLQTVCLICYNNYPQKNSGSLRNTNSSTQGHYSYNNYTNAKIRLVSFTIGWLIISYPTGFTGLWNASTNFMSAEDIPSGSIGNLPPRYLIITPGLPSVLYLKIDVSYLNIRIIYMVCFLLQIRSNT
jgi:hypothetical protein